MQYDVSTAQELSAAIATVHAGDTVVVAPGQYTLAELDCLAVGNATQPIVVRAQQPLTAQLRLASSEGVRVEGAYWTFEGFDVLGVCGLDADCERAFHVVGGADGFVLRSSRVVDFNRQVDVDTAGGDGGATAVPAHGLLEGNDLHDTHARATTGVVAKVSIGAADGWTVRANLVHDFQRADGATASGIALSGSGTNTLVERNLVLCTHDWIATKGSSAVGVSVVDHTGTVLRNDVVVSCSADGIAVARGAGTRVWFDTLVDTAGVDLGEAATTGEARGNVLGASIRAADSGAVTVADNLERVGPNQFLLMYRAPLDGDLRALSPGSLDALIGKGPPIAGVTDDYCARSRAAPYNLGALQASLGDCATIPPPLTAPDGGAADAGEAGASSEDAGVPLDAMPGEGGAGADAAQGGGGCGCGEAGRAGGGGLAVAAAFVLALSLIPRARRRTSSPRLPR